MRRSPCPSLTRQRDSLSALGCLSRVMTCPTTIPSNSPPSFWTPSTSRPSMVRRSASSSADQLNSTYCRSQLRVTFMGSELAQKPQVVLVEQADIGNTVADHGNALDAEAKGPAGPKLRIPADILEHLRVHH